MTTLLLCQLRARLQVGSSVAVFVTRVVLQDPGRKHNCCIRFLTNHVELESKHLLPSSECLAQLFAFADSTALILFAVLVNKSKQLWLQALSWHRWLLIRLQWHVARTVATSVLDLSSDSAQV